MYEQTAEDNLTIEALYSLGTRIVRMFEKIAIQYGTIELRNRVPLYSNTEIEVAIIECQDR